MGPVRDRTTVPRVSHQRARQKHRTQVVAIQHVHCQRGGGRTALTGVGGSILDGEHREGQSRDFPPSETCVSTLTSNGICRFPSVPEHVTRAAAAFEV